MRAALLIQAFMVALCLNGTPVNAQAPGTDDTVAGDALLRSARMWEMKGRSDMQRSALEKYLRAHPNDPHGSLLLGQLEIRAGRYEDAARVIENLKKAHPGHPAITDLSAAYRVATRDRLQMATVDRLMQIGKPDEAVAALRKLLPDGPPGGELGIDYYRIIDSTPRGRREAREGLRRLARENPGDAKFILALSEHLMRHPETRNEGFALVEALARRSDVDREKVLETWRDGLDDLDDDNPRSRALLAAYLAADPRESQMRSRMDGMQRTLRRQRQRRADPAYQSMQAGVAALDDGELEEAETALSAARQARPADAQITGHLGRLRLRQGRHDEAIELFQRAARGDAESRGKWRSLERTARYWKLIRESEAAAQGGDLQESERKIRAALALDPREPGGLAALAENSFRRGRTAEAEAQYRKLLARDAASGDALAGYARLLSETGRREDALALLDTLNQKQPRAAANAGAVRARLLRERAEAALAAGETGDALRDLEAAQEADPADPWVRYDLAQLYRQLGLSGEARTLMAQGVERAPRDADARYAYALVLSALDDEPAALAQLSQIPAARRSDSMRALERRLTIAQQRRAALQLARSGKPRRAQAQMERAQVLAGADLELLESVALGWRDLGEPRRGLGLIEAHQARAGSAATADLIVAARAYNSLEADATLLTTLDELTRRDLSASERERVAGWRVQLALREARALTQARRHADALAVLERAQAGQPANPQLAAARASAHLDSGDARAAAAIYQTLLRTQPDDLDLRLDLARALRARGDETAAREQLREVAQRNRGGDSGVRLALVRQYLALGELDEARAILMQLQRSAGAGPEVWEHAGRVAREDRRYEEALAYFRQAQRLENLQHAGLAQAVAARPLPLQLSFDLSGAPAQNTTRPKTRIAGLQLAQRLDQDDAQSDAQPVPPLPAIAAPSAAQEGIASIERRRQGHAAFGLHVLRDPGDPGVSNNEVREASFELRLPRRYHGHWLALVDRVEVEAGTLPADYDEAKRLGQVAAVGPASVAAFPAGLEQSARGTAVGLGYETEHWRADIGTTPIGFPVEDIVGGLRYDGRLQALYYAVGVSRRAVTGSLLSYAGVHDPVSGEVWGGVRATGIDGRLAHYGERFSASLSGGLQRLSGQNVPDNDFLSARVSGDWRFYDSINNRAFAGLALTQWSYAENLNQYTYGHGGYYSPQSYTSLALPLEWSGRRGDLAYLLRGSVNISHSREDSAPFYPQRPDLQALAARFEQPQYEGGSGGGSGYALQGALEYRISPHYFAGALYEIDRSAFYAPNFATLYLRYTFAQQLAPIVFPPRPQRSYARY